MGLAAGRQTQAEVKLQIVIFLEDSLSPLLFVISMLTLNYSLRKCKGDYIFTKSEEKIKPLMYMDGSKILVQNEKKKKKKIEYSIQTI